MHEGPVSFDRDENTLFFTRSNQTQGVSKADKSGKVVLKIYEATRGIYDWENVRELPFNQDSFSCMHPALSPDGTRLFFASNMPGGYGGMDIYLVERIGTTWSDPINLGPEINTIKEEAFPFMHESGTLFFASNGHRGLGGLDMFSIDIGASVWGKLANLGEPLNSPSDDFGIILKDNKGLRGYFSSNRREGMGRDDIYLFEAPTGLQGVRTPELFTLRVNVLDVGSNFPASGVSVFLFERAPDGSIKNDSAYNVELTPSAEGLELNMVRKSLESMGEPDALTGRSGDAIIQMAPLRDYVILAAKDGYKTVEVPFSPESAEPGAPLNISLERSNCIELRGVVVAEGPGVPIPNARILIKSSCDGKEQWVQSNIDGAYEYCLDLGCSYTLVGKKEGYKDYQTQVSLVNVRGSRSFTVNLKMEEGVPAGTPEKESIPPATPGKPIAEGTVIVLNNIYYDFNKSVIRSGQARDLEALARLMNLYPSLEIELGAHTDCRGSAEYNLSLSKERAEAAKTFLINRGIGPSRIKAVGYGETQPRNGCVDGVNCSESEYQFNRRTEVKVLKIDESDDFNK
ncbi:MAG: OmpA family protein [Haliscomenobacter sp.]|nr:OmpA family protein [Haliscomenobacter sp.]